MVCNEGFPTGTMVYNKDFSAGKMVNIDGFPARTMGK